MPDLSASEGKIDLVDVDPHDPTTTSKPEAPMQSLNQLPMDINLAVNKINLITRINSCKQSKNEQELEASNLMYCTKVEF